MKSIGQRVCVQKSNHTALCRSNSVFLLPVSWYPNKRARCRLRVTGRGPDPEPANKQCNRPRRERGDSFLLLASATRRVLNALKLSNTYNAATASQTALQQLTTGQLSSTYTCIYAEICVLHDGCIRTPRVQSTFFVHTYLKWLSLTRQFGFVVYDLEELF
jgi:hypothetical protein